MADHYDKYRWGNSRAAILLRNKIEESDLTQREIGAAVGYDNPNVLSMIKRGEAKIPMEKIPALARVLKVDPVHLTRLVMEQVWVNEERMVADMFGTLLTQNQRAWIALIRDLTGEDDPVLNPDLGAAIEMAIELVGGKKRAAKEPELALKEKQ